MSEVRIEVSTKEAKGDISRNVAAFITGCLAEGRNAADPEAVAARVRFVAKHVPAGEKQMIVILSREEEPYFGVTTRRV